jgi:hypothetical protein
MILEDYQLKKVKLSDGYSEEQLVIHDPTNKGLVHLLSNMEHPNCPIPIGVMKEIDSVNSYDEDFHNQIKEQVHARGKGSIKDLLHSGETWEVN